MSTDEKKKLLALHRLQQAEESLQEALYLFAGGKSLRSVVNRIYYGMFILMRLLASRKVIIRNDTLREITLLEALREYGVEITRSQEDEVKEDLVAYALAKLDEPLSKWKKITPDELISGGAILQTLAKCK